MDKLYPNEPEANKLFDKYINKNIIENISNLFINFSVKGLKDNIKKNIRGINIKIPEIIIEIKQIILEPKDSQ